MRPAEIRIEEEVVMKSTTRFCVVVLLTLGLSFAASGAFAGSYPDHDIQLVIPNAAGSSMDIGGRMIAAELEKILGKSIIPTNKPGAGTVLGTDLVVKGKKDGYTLLYGDLHSALIIAPIITPEVVPFDASKDIEAIGYHFSFPNTITVSAESPWKTFPELIEYAKKNPGKVRFSIMGINTHPHLLLEIIQAETGAQFTHIPFKGGESVVTAVLGGHVEATCHSLAGVQSHVEAGKMRVLLFNIKMPAFPAIPTMTELGYPRSLPVAGFGLFAPAGIPEEARKVLVPAMEKAVMNTRSKVDQMYGVLDYRSPSQVRKMWEEEYQKIQEIADKIGLRKR
jgi:tripartite-type tricarboxylate transporter receptor subunit TctC